MKVKTACAYVILMCIRGCQIDNTGQLDKVLFTVRYTDKQITALIFFCHYKNNDKSPRQNYLILKVEKWIQRSDSNKRWILLIVEISINMGGLH